AWRPAPGPTEPSAHRSDPPATARAGRARRPRRRARRTRARRGTGSRRQSADTPCHPPYDHVYAESRTRMTLLDDARRLWETLAGAPVAFGERGLNVVVSPGSLLCPPGWVGVVMLGDSAIATAPDERRADRLRRAWTTFDAIAETVTW